MAPRIDVNGKPSRKSLIVWINDSEFPGVSMRVSLWLNPDDTVTSKSQQGSAEAPVSPFPQNRLNHRREPWDNLCSILRDSGREPHRAHHRGSLVPAITESKIKIAA